MRCASIWKPDIDSRRRTAIAACWFKRVLLRKSPFSALLMRQCWHADSDERPTFPDILSRIGRRLRNIAAKEYGYLDAANDYCVSLPCSSHDVSSLTALLRARDGARLH